MVDRNLIRSLQDDSLEDQYDDILGDLDFDQVIIDDDAPEVDLQKIITGRVIHIRDDSVLIDVGFKSEGTIPLNEWEDEEEQPKVGDELQVLVEDLEDESGKTEDPFGMISLSWKRAKQILEWEDLMKSVQEGMVVTGTAIRKIKGGLLVNIGVQVFLPASQVDIRRPHDIGDYIGRFVQCEVLKIDEARRNIVVSRRSLIEKQREEDRERLLRELEEGQIRKGVVKNIADFGAFVDLGGIDGLLHITDMDYKRIGHPSEKVSIDQEIDVMILNIDREKQKIALGLKQMQANPWDNIAEKYPVGEKFPGEVVNVMTYGAFVMLEPGIEGLVHISEMSWTERINHPNEMVQIGDKIDVVILSIDKQRNQLSLGIKQTQSNPWDEVMKKYPVESTITGKVRNLTSYGAFIELEKGIDGLLHVSDMSWVKKVNHPSEVLEKGQEVECKILAVDQERRRIALGLKQLDQDPWASDIPSKYQPGQVVNGKVTKITNFGVFVGLEDGLEGLLHISELADHKVDNPEELVNVGDDLEVKILRVDTEERKIGLSRKRVEWNEEDGIADGSGEYVAGEGSGDLKGGLGESGPLFKSPEAEKPAEEAPAAEAATEEPAAEEPAAE
ncbi:MAG: 30S ribosomal protein S1, partial [bacterium]|nr:30S ribosomal protein S1 [bacterium]